MDWYTTVFEVIDMRSFSNLWYWIMLAILWSTVTHWVLGVPWDMVHRARRHGGQLEEDLHTLVMIYARRLVHIAEVAGFALVWFSSAILSALAVLGFWYGVEFAQAVFLMLFPLAIVTGLSFAVARRVVENGETGETLYRRLRLHRLVVRMIGMISIFVTAMWGMYQNLVVGPLGG
ncbi:MAG: component of SufBCD complex [Alphaproteobacteria bacterium]|nr:MAG: component of SufBCD complex [Alphaproteobacteria bacterium]